MCHSGHDDDGPGAFVLLAIAEDCGELSFIHTWNDHPKRTHEDVMRVLGRAIELARTEEATS